MKVAVTDTCGCNFSEGPIVCQDNSPPPPPTPVAFNGFSPPPPPVPISGFPWCKCDNKAVLPYKVGVGSVV